MDHRETPRGFLLRLDRGEEIISTLTRWLEEKDIRFGALTGIGAVDDPELGLFTMKTKEYLRTRFEGEYEIVNLTGNVSTVDGKPFPHIHGLFSDLGCQVVGGHVFHAEVAVTCEIDLAVYPGEVKRSKDAITTLNLLDFRA
ncbi:MAG: PPC domain-containing DNA-binding protein [Candidatus Krumholzibacteriia bacterium]